VRLGTARTHKKAAKDISRNGGSKQQVQQEKKLYSKVKKAHWVLLQNKENLDSEKQQSLNEILDSHSDLAACYAMKEELCTLFQISDEAEALQRWTKWFDAAIHSNIPSLAKFGRQKLKRLDGLVAHAKFPINTGKLEGFNNKIKVTKRNAYGFRNLDFFFPISAFFLYPEAS
jgi:transposase